MCVCGVRAQGEGGAVMRTAATRKERAKHGRISAIKCDVFRFFVCRRGSDGVGEPVFDVRARNAYANTLNNNNTMIIIIIIIV